MIEIEKAAWETMVGHAQIKFPNECCGAMLGRIDGDRKLVTVAVPIENAHEGPQGARYEISPQDLLAAEREARARAWTWSASSIRIPIATHTSRKQT